jgi:hypothetical protein
MMLLALLLVAAPPSGWEEQSRNNGIVIYNRSKTGSDIKEVLAIGTFDAPPEKVHRVLDDGGHYKDFMPYCKVSRILKRDDKNVWSYERINPPLINERDYTVKISHAEVKKPDGTVVVHHMFTQSNADGPAPVDGVIRLSVLDGRWELEPIEGGKKTRATYYVYTSPGGDVPTFIVNAANSTAVPNIFDAVRNGLKTHAH